MMHGLDPRALTTVGVAINDDGDPPDLSNETRMLVSAAIAGEISAFGTPPSAVDANTHISRADLVHWLRHNEYEAMADGLDMSPTTQTNNAPKVPVSTPATGDDAWRTIARDRAHAIIKRQHAKDLYPSQVHIADEIAIEFRRDGVVGADGKPVSGSTIKRHALAGISSARGKQLSTKMPRGK